MQAQLIIHNLGGRPVRVTSVTAKIFRDRDEIASFDARSFLQNPTDTNAALLTTFYVQPKGEWVHIVNFLNYLTRIEENKYRSAEAKLKDDIFEKRKQIIDKETLAAASPELVTPFIEMFKQKFVWNPGEYRMQITLETVPPKAGLSKVYRFVLFESDTEVLNKFTEGYKHGDGIYFETGKHKGVFAEINE